MRAAFVLSAIICCATLALAESPIITRGPYLQNATPHSMVIRWRTDVPTSSRVRYGLSLEALTGVVSDETPATEHEITVDGLPPDTAYLYTVGDATADLAGPDNEHWFRTLPIAGTEQPVRVWVIGDSGTGGDGTGRAESVLQGYINSPHFAANDVWLMLGDNAYQSGTDEEYQLAVFNIYTRLLRHTRLWPALGNHETYGIGLPFADMFTLPSNGEAGGVASGTENYYSFDYANIHFVCLDSMLSDRTAGSPMLTWLEADLESTTQRWIIAYWHHPPYSHGTHDSDWEPELVEMRENVVPILEAHGVDLVLSGHSHNYERTFLIDGHYGDSTTFAELMKKDGGSGQAAIDGSIIAGAYAKTPTPHAGTVYVVAGNAGQVGGSFPHPAMFTQINVLGSLVLDVHGRRLDAKMITSDGVVSDYFTIIRNTPPAPINDRVIAPVAGALTIQPLANDFDADGDSLAIIAVTNGEFGSVTFSEGELTYTPVPGGLRGDQFTYTVSDGFGGTVTATAFIDMPLPQFRGDYTQLLRSAFFYPYEVIYGRLTLTLNAGGAFTGRLLLGGRTDPVTGVFGSDGRAHVVVARPEALSVEMTLYLQMAGNTPHIVGEVTEGIFKWPVNASAVLYDSEHQPPAGKGGRYTFAALNPRQLIFDAGGHAWAVFAGEHEGRVRLLGRFPDGEVFFGDAQMQPDGTLPLYLARRDYPIEALAGVLRFTGVHRRNLEGELMWNIYVSEVSGYFSQSLPVRGGRFHPPAADEPILRFPEGSPARATARLFSHWPGFPWTQTFRIEANGISLLSQEKNPISLQFSRSTGQFTGSFNHPKFGPCRITGVLLQRENMVRGNFSGNGVYGGFRLIPR